ncbi:YheC/YheD family protein [Bacillus sp. FJAT-29814]|uniref:YheC/YheD family endospore coat-associated protein n=1 Tax=Bacillus sp. FJAT-29814 TaxID=1729688 RepID=UPI0008300BA0|nr:YheC/YheD family protein [Bacillus sp. FJAT-29814]
MAFSLIPVTVAARKPTNTKDRFIQLSSELHQQLQLNQTEAIKLICGKTVVTADIQLTDNAGNEILVSENIFIKFSLPLNSHKFQAVYKQDINTLQIGPIIGLVTDFPEPGQGQPNFRSIHAFCEELHHGIQERGGFFYVFRHDRFPIHGYYFQNGAWHEALLPLPDVIYNRIHSRKLEHSPSFKKFRNQLEQLAIPLFNDRFLSKWDVYQRLSEGKQLLSALPETKIFSKENLYDFVQTYETVFIKPVHGSQGRNIIKITRVQDGLFSIQSSLHHKPENSANHYPLSELYQVILTLLRNRIYIIQQGIPFLTLDTKPVDFRVLCHKNINHRWVVTSTIARIGADEEFVANLARGGTSMKPLRALRAVLDNKQASKALVRIKELSLTIAESVSMTGSGLTGELGIDIGVDLAGNPWLIEVNSKPSKLFEDEPGKIRPSATAIIELCTMLAFDSMTEKED